MAKDIETLKQQALQIKNEVEDGANTADRVGGMFGDMLDYNEEKLTELSSGIGNVSIYFSLEYQLVQIPFTIKQGETIFLSSEDGITELNCRTGSDISSESPQLVKNGDIAEKDINYVRCLTVLGTVNIYTDGFK